MTTRRQKGGRATFTVKETSEALGIGLNQAYQAVHAGTIPSIRIGNRMLVPAWFIRRLEEGGPETEREGLLGAATGSEGRSF